MAVCIASRVGRLQAAKVRVCSLGLVWSRPAVSHTSVAPQLPPCDVQPKPYEGMSYERAMSVRKKHVSPGYLTYYRQPVMICQGHMQYLWDTSGKRYLDLFGGIVTVSVGHCHPKVKQALSDQMDLLWHTTNIYLHPKIHEYAEKLVARLPGDLKVCYFTNSGSEANELAVTMARLHTARHDVVALRNAYHGASPYTVALTASSNWQYNLPRTSAVVHAVNPDVYRGPWGGAHCRDSPSQTDRPCACRGGECAACDAYVDQLDDAVAHSCAKVGPAAFIVESIQGVGGTVQFPRDYVRRAFELVRARGGLCIADEVQTGFGRTGEHYWGFESHGAAPDVVTVAKGIGNGFPLAAVVTTPAVAATMSSALHFNTYGGNPLACAVGCAVLDAIDDDGCQQVALERGTQMIAAMRRLRERYAVVGDVRGKGLMIGVELVADRDKRTPLPPAEVGDIWEECKDAGLLLGKGGHHGNVFRIKPPMCVSSDDVEFAAAVIERALMNHEARRSEK